MGVEAEEGVMVNRLEGSFENREPSVNTVIPVPVFTGAGCGGNPVFETYRHPVSSRMQHPLL